MKDHKRGLRRAHRQRMIAHALRVVRTWNTRPEHWVTNQKTWEEVERWEAGYALRRHDDLAHCDCSHCRNPRTSCWYRGQERMTMQERRNIDWKNEDDGEK